MNCRNCEHDKLHTDYFSGDQYHFCRKYLDNIDPNKANKCKDYKSKTRGDKIRSMTDEELADFIQRVEIGDFNCNDYGKTFCDMCDGQYECDDCLKYWLKHPAEGE